MGSQRQKCKKRSVSYLELACGRSVVIIFETYDIGVSLETDDVFTTLATDGVVIVVIIFETNDIVNIVETDYHL